MSDMICEDPLSAKQSEIVSVIENPLLSSLRMPRKHELNFNISNESSNESENYIEKKEDVHCKQCKRTLIFEDFHLEDFSSNFDKICNSCDIDLLAEETVGNVLKNISLNKNVTTDPVSDMRESKQNSQASENSNQTLAEYDFNSQNGCCDIQQRIANDTLEEKDNTNSTSSEKSNEHITTYAICKTNTRKRSSGKQGSDIITSVSKSKSSENLLEININSKLKECQKPKFAYSKSEPYPSEDSKDNYLNVQIHNGFQLSHFYKEEESIGNGKFGKVSKVSHRETNEIYAVKTVIYRNEETKRHILNEIEILDSLYGDDHVLKLIEVINNSLCRPKVMHIITEYLGGGELFDQIAKDDLLTEEQIIDIMQQILNGISFIHNHGIIHRDIKPENLVYTSKDSGQLKIIDFGFAVKFNSKNPPKTMVGTTLFVAPEVLRYESQSYSTDMWSIGVVAFNLLAGITPFEIPLTGDLERQLTDREIIENIERCQYNFDDEGFTDVSEDAKDFISKLLIRNPSKRMTAGDCLNHRWLSSSYRKRPKKLSRSISIKRVKNYVAFHKWQKVAMAIHTINNFKSYNLYKS